MGRPRLPQPGAATADGSGHGGHSPLLAHDLLIESGFQPGKALPFFLAHPLGGDAAGPCHHLGHLLPG